MIKRYCMIIFSRFDDDAVMHPMPDGNYVKYEDHQAEINALQDKIDSASDVFTNMKNLNMKNNSVCELNTICQHAIDSLK